MSAPSAPSPESGVSAERELATDHLIDDLGRRSRRGGAVLLGAQLVRVLAQMATVAFQTLYPVRRQKELAREAAGGKRERPRIIGTCLAYEPSSPVVKLRWPWLAPEAAE